MADLNALFKIRNEVSTYQYSLNPREVNEEEHFAWLTSLINESRVNMVCLVNGDLAGICYLTCKDSVCTFSIYLTAKYMGLGLGKQLLFKTLEETKNIKFKKLLAEIHKNNISSILL